MNKFAIVGAIALVLATSADAKFSLKKLVKPLKKAASVAVKAQQLGLLEEEEWSVNAGISGQGGRPSWNVGVSHSWEEEQEEEQKIKLHNIVKAVQIAGAVGLLEEEDVTQMLGGAISCQAYPNAPFCVSLRERWALEEEQAKMLGQEGTGFVSGVFEEEEEQKFKLGKALKKAANVAVKAQQLGLLEEEEEEQKFKLGKALKKAANVAVKAKELGLLEEEEEAQAMMGAVNCQAHPNAPFCVTLRERWAQEALEEEEQKFKLGKALKKAASVAVKAQQLGLLEEEEWSVNAGISGQGGRPSWNVGVSHSWDEEEQKVNWDKVFKIAEVVKGGIDLAKQAHDSGLFEEVEVVKQDRPIRKFKNRPHPRRRVEKVTPQ